MSGWNDVYHEMLGRTGQRECPTCKGHGVVSSDTEGIERRLAHTNEQLRKILATERARADRLAKCLDYFAQGVMWKDATQDAFDASLAALAEHRKARGER